MADEQDDTLEGGEGIVADEDQQQADTTDTPVEDEGDPDPLEAVAREIGWSPKENFKGDPAKWRPARDFIVAGRDIQQILARDLKDMRSTMDNVARTSAQLFQDRLDQERDKLRGEYAKAVDDGDTERSWEVAQRLTNIEQQAKPAPDATVNEWVERNPWMTTDPLASARAREVSNIYAKNGKSTAEQLKAAEDTVRREYPHLFGEQRQAPTVGRPASRNAAPPPRKKGFNDMPREAQTVAKDMADRKLIASVDDYARNFWANKDSGQ